MRDGLLFSLLPLLQERPAPCVRQQHRAALAEVKIDRFEHTVVDEREHKAVGKARAQLLHQIERQRLPPWPVAVEISDVGVQPYAFKRRGAVVREQTVSKRQQRVERIERRTAAALAEEKRLFSLQDHVVQHAEICRRTDTLEAAQTVERRLRCDLQQKPL